MSEQTILNTETPAAETTTASVLQPTENSILDQQPEPSQLDLFPEAFRVMNGETLDVAASTKALSEAYNARAAFGTIPANDELYAAPEGFEHWEEVKTLEAVKSFQDEAKKLGFTNEQFGFAMNTIAAAELDGRNHALKQNREASEAALREEWKDPNSYDLNVKQATGALNALVPEAERNEFLQRYGNDASIIKMLARIGGELSEDQALGILQPVPTGEDVQTLMQSEAYTNSKHPQHMEAMRKVQTYYAKHYGTQAAL